MNQVPIDCWRKFFGNFRKYYVEPSSSPDIAIDIGATEAFFTQYEKRYKRFWESGSAINIWEVAGLKRDEVRNTAILAWLLDCHGSHGQGNAFLRCFLDCIKSIPENEKAKVLEMIQDCNIGSAYRTITERAFTKNSSIEESVKRDSEDRQSDSRVDIVIEGSDFILFIEVKIDAGEGKEQISRYVNILSECTAGRKCGLVFLTRSEKKPESIKDDDKSKEIAVLGWKRLANYIEKYVRRHTKGLDLQEWPLWVRPVLQFCQHIRTF